MKNLPETAELIIESKAVEEINVVHEAQRRTYLKPAGIKTGLLMNVNVTKQPVEERC